MHRLIYNDQGMQISITPFDRSLCSKVTHKYAVLKEMYASSSSKHNRTLKKIIKAELNLA